MAANLTPQYLKAEENYRRAQTPDEELQWLQVMFRELPKHKASEKVQSDLKQKIARLKDEVEAQRRAPKSTTGIRIARQGAGTALLLGGPNAGKSALLAALTRATPEVAPYPFSTRQPLPGMMPWEDVFVQLVDTPPITASMLEPYLQGMIRSADLCLLVVDLASDDGIDDCRAVIERLAETKTRLARNSRFDEDDIGLSYTATFLVPNKIDTEDADIRVSLLHEMFPLDWPEFVVSATRGDGLAELRQAIYAALDVVRVYTKTPTARQADFSRPFTVRRGETVLDVAQQVHNDLAEKFKFARVWGSAVHDGQVVKADYQPHDKDVVELHV